MEFKRSFIVDQPIQEVWEVLGNQFGQAYLWASGLYHSQGFGTPKLEGASCINQSIQS